VPLLRCIVGPTASGKSALAARLAAAEGGEVVCGDAFQLYAGFPILSAQPTAAERSLAPHHLYGSISPTEELDAARYERLARATIAEIQGRGRLPILVGGSGLYVKAITHGLSPLPPGDPALRARLEAMSGEMLAAELLARDPGAGASLNLRNPRHVARALEVCILTGQPASMLKTSFHTPLPEGLTGLVIVCDRAQLYARIDARTHAMITAGAIDEVAAHDHVALSKTAEKMIGLRELRAVRSGVLSLADAIASIQQSTRRYAKRQAMWFRRESWLQTVPMAVPQ
jgi:tRNA dimethylallyltransferase